MDFNFSEEQEAIRALADEVFTSRAGIDRVKEIEGTAERVDRDLWRELANTGLLAIALPENLGGGGLGLSELYVLLEQQGRHVAPVPIWQTALAALAVAELGTAEQAAALVPGVADGSKFLTIGLEEFGPYVDGDPSTTATEASVWRSPRSGSTPSKPRGNSSRMKPVDSVPERQRSFSMMLARNGTLWRMPSM